MRYLALLLLVGCAVQVEPKELMDQAAVVHVDSGMGSGVIWKETGRILALTANHVVAQTADVKLEMYESGLMLEGKVIRRDEETDLALIEVNADLPLGPLFLTDVNLGDKVCSVGAPFGETFCFIQSEVIKLMPDHVYVRGPTLPGCSGGPVFKGRMLTGVMVQASAGGQLGRFVPCWKIRAFLRK